MPVRVSCLGRSAFPAFTLFLSLASLASLAPLQARAQSAAPAAVPASVPASGQNAAPHRHLPITTGTSQTSMDAPEKNSQLESYAHSPVVRSIARRLGISTGLAARIFEDFNSGVLFAVILYYLLKILPGKFRAKRQGLDHDLVRARQATVDAQERLNRVEARLAALGGEVEALRRQAEETGKGEQARMQAAMEQERQRIVRSAQAEIAAAQATAVRGLRRYASDLAVDRAAQRVRLTPEGDRVLVDEFLQGLGAELGRRGQN